MALPHCVEKRRHSSWLQPVFRHLIDGNAPVDDLVLRVELDEREKGLPRLLHLGLDEGVNPAFRILSFSVAWNHFDRQPW